MNERVEPENVLSDEERVTLVDALRTIRNKLHWKPGKTLFISKNASV